MLRFLLAETLNIDDDLVSLDILSDSNSIDLSYTIYDTSVQSLLETDEFQEAFEGHLQTYSQIAYETGTASNSKSPF
eukprot:UN25483